jgi:hypothetical protein
MTWASWVNTAIGVIVGLPILWVIYRAFRSMRGAEANVWRALPAGAAPDFHVVFALAAPLEERLPSKPEDFAAISVTVPGQRAGLTLGPGKYWLYAVPARSGVNETEALDAAATAVAQHRAQVMAFDDLPVTVS